MALKDINVDDEVLSHGNKFWKLVNYFYHLKIEVDKVNFTNPLIKEALNKQNPIKYIKQKCKLHKEDKILPPIPQCIICQLSKC